LNFRLQRLKNFDDLNKSLNKKTYLPEIKKESLNPKIEVEHKQLEFIKRQFSPASVKSKKSKNDKSNDYEIKKLIKSSLYGNDPSLNNFFP